MRLFRSLLMRLRTDENAPVFGFHVVRRYHIFFESAFTLATNTMKLPLMPWTNDVIAFERTFAQRSTRMITRAVDRSENAIFVGQRNANTSNHDLLYVARGEFLHAAYIDPFFIHRMTHADAHLG